MRLLTAIDGVTHLAYTEAFPGEQARTAFGLTHISSPATAAEIAPPAKARLEMRPDTGAHEDETARISAPTELRPEGNRYDDS
jgi:hypothetical protein